MSYLFIYLHHSLSSFMKIISELKAAYLISILLQFTRYLLWQMNMIKVSNIMGIEPKPFDPKIYLEEDDSFVTDEFGSRKRIRLQNNIVRWRMIKHPNGKSSVSIVVFFLFLLHIFSTC